MKRSYTKSFLLASVVATMAGSTLAQDRSGENLGTGSGQLTPTASAVASASDALGLAAWARENEDAEAMLVAARMLASIGTLGEGAEPEATASSTATGAASGTAPSSDALFDEAVALAEGEPGIIGRVTAARSVMARGRDGGPTSWVRDISAYSSVSYRITANGGYVWNMIAAGDGDTDVDMEIFDQNGNLICRDISPYSRAQCSLTPAWTGPFTVRITNLGSVWTRTLFVTN